jgi:hypothetical protein
MNILIKAIWFILFINIEYTKVVRQILAHYFPEKKIKTFLNMSPNA